MFLEMLPLPMEGPVLRDKRAFQITVFFGAEILVPRWEGFPVQDLFGAPLLPHRALSTFSLASWCFALASLGPTVRTTCKAGDGGKPGMHGMAMHSSMLAVGKSPGRRSPAALTESSEGRNYFHLMLTSPPFPFSRVLSIT